MGEQINSQVCPQCKKIFFGRKKQKYCSAECRYAADAERRKNVTYEKVCPYCGNKFETHNKKAIYCSSICAARKNADEVRGEYFCEYCGKPRHSDHPNRNRFCSRKCAREAQRERTRQKHELMLEEKERTKVCKWCGKEFRTRKSNQKYCSYACDRKANDNTKRIHSMEQYEGKIFYCAECGKKVVTQYGNTKRVYCSEICMDRAARRRYTEGRKQQMLNAYVEPAGMMDAFKRANGICQICGLPVPRTNEPKNIWAATRDHIIPLSKGGKHCKANVQLAHRICNSMKLDTLDGFSIDWFEKMTEEPGRWESDLENLEKQLSDG